MSLDVSLKIHAPLNQIKTGLFIKVGTSQTEELTFADIKRKFPDLIILDTFTEVFDANITHNLGKMANEAGIYYACWRPEEIGATRAKDIIILLEKGLNDLEQRPGYFKQFNPRNGWGDYRNLAKFVRSYLDACKEYPEARIEADR